MGLCVWLERCGGRKHDKFLTSASLTASLRGEGKRPGQLPHFLACNTPGGVVLTLHKLELMRGFLTCELLISNLPTLDRIHIPSSFSTPTLASFFPFQV
jgi:hypothetical protein